MEFNAEWVVNTWQAHGHTAAARKPRTFSSNRGTSFKRLSYGPAPARLTVSGSMRKYRLKGRRNAVVRCRKCCYAGIADHTRTTVALKTARRPLTWRSMTLLITTAGTSPTLPDMAYSSPPSTRSWHSASRTQSQRRCDTHPLVAHDRGHTTAVRQPASSAGRMDNNCPNTVVSAGTRGSLLHSTMAVAPSSPVKGITDDNGADLDNTLGFTRLTALPEAAAEAAAEPGRSGLLGARSLPHSKQPSSCRVEVTHTALGQSSKHLARNGLVLPRITVDEKPAREPSHS